MDHLDEIRPPKRANDPAPHKTVSADTLPAKRTASGSNTKRNRELQLGRKTRTSKRRVKSPERISLTTLGPVALLRNSGGSIFYHYGHNTATTIAPVSGTVVTVSSGSVRSSPSSPWTLPPGTTVTTTALRNRLQGATTTDLTTPQTTLFYEGLRVPLLLCHTL